MVSHLFDLVNLSDGKLGYDMFNIHRLTTVLFPNLYILRIRDSCRFQVKDIIVQHDKNIREQQQ